MHIVTHLVLIIGLIHFSSAEDEFDYCAACRSVRELSHDWPCALCAEEKKVNPSDRWPEKNSKESTQVRDSQYNTERTRNVASANSESNNDKARLEAQRTWLYTKIVISLILIIGSAFMCHYRYKRMKRMGELLNDHEAAMHAFQPFSYPPQPFFHSSSQNIFLHPHPDASANRYTPMTAQASAASYPALGFSTQTENVPPPLPNNPYPPTSVPYPPPYTPYSPPQGFISYPQTHKPLIVHSLQPGICPQGMQMAPSTSDSTSETAPSSDTSPRIQTTTPAQALSPSAEAQSLAYSECSIQQGSNLPSEETEPSKSSEETENGKNISR